MKKDKAFYKELKSIATELPQMFTSDNTKTYQWVTGEELNRMGLKVKGEVVPGRKYRIETGAGANGGATVNHFKRMRNLYDTYGIDRVKNYINEVFSISQGHQSVLNSLQERLNKAI